MHSFLAIIDYKLTKDNHFTCLINEHHGLNVKFLLQFHIVLFEEVLNPLEGQIMNRTCRA